MSILSRPHFHNQEAAFAYLESAIWAEGPVCPHCGCRGRISKVKANVGKRIRIGLHRCGDCKGQFRATVGTAVAARDLECDEDDERFKECCGNWRSQKDP